MEQWTKEKWEKEFRAVVQSNRVDKVRWLLARRDFRFLEIDRLKWENKTANTISVLDVAVANDNAEMVRLLLAEGLKVNSLILTERKQEGYTSTHFCPKTALYKSVESQQLQMAKLLLELGADANIKGNHDTIQYPPIYTAAAQGNAAMVKLLLENGADSSCNISTKSSNALHESVRRGLIEVVKTILAAKKGKLINSMERHYRGTDDSNCTALHIAVKMADEAQSFSTSKAMVKLLLENGADPEIVGYHESEKLKGTPLQWAIALRLPEIAQIIQEFSATQNPRVAEKTAQKLLIIPTLPKVDITSALDKVTSKSAKEEELQRAKKIADKIEANDRAQEEHQVAITKLQKANEQLRDQADYRDEQYMQQLEDELTEIEALLLALQTALPQKQQEKQEDDDDKMCPVCFLAPEQVFCCETCDNWVCGKCCKDLKSCPTCRQDFALKPLRRNKAVEKLLART